MTAPIEHAWALLKADSPEEEDLDDLWRRVDPRNEHAYVHENPQSEEIHPDHRYYWADDQQERERVAEMLRAAEERKRIELLRMTADPERAAEAKRMLREMDPEGPQY